MNVAMLLMLLRFGLTASKFLLSALLEIVICLLLSVIYRNLWQRQNCGCYPQIPRFLNRTTHKSPHSLLQSKNRLRIQLQRRRSCGVADGLLRDLKPQDRRLRTVTHEIIPVKSRSTMTFPDHGAATYLNDHQTTQRSSIDSRQ